MDNNNQTRIAFLKKGALKNEQDTLVHLRSVSDFSTAQSNLQVDFDNGIIRNCAVISVGPARGQGWQIDRAAVSKVYNDIATAGDTGVTVRWKHPEEINEEMLGRVIGHLRNPKLVGDTCRADVYLEEYAKHLPREGDVYTYLLKLAEKRPHELGLSTVIHVSEGDYEIDGEPVGVVSQLDYVDFVGSPAGNPNGLLSAKTNTRNSKLSANVAGGATRSKLKGVRQNMKLHKTLKTLLIQAGCAAGESDVAFRAFYDALPKDRKDAIDSTFAQVEGEGVDGFKAAEEPKDEPADADVDVDGDADADADVDGDTDTDVDTSSDDANTANNVAIAGAPAALRKRINAIVAEQVTKMLKSNGTNGKKTALAQRNGKNPTIADGNSLVVLAEKKRCDDIKALARSLDFNESDKNEITKAIASGATVTGGVRTQFLSYMQNKTAKTFSGIGDSSTGRIFVGDDKGVKNAAAIITDAIMLRTGMINKNDPKQKDRVAKLHEGAESMKNRPLSGMFQEWLCLMGADRGEVMTLGPSTITQMLGKRGLQKRMPRIAMLAESTSDFPSLLLDAMHKSMRSAYIESDRMWPMLARQKYATDYKIQHRIQISDAPSMVSRDEAKEVLYQTLTDSQEQYGLNEYTSGITVTRRTIINDDLDALAAIPKKFAQTAARLEDSIVFGIFTLNPTMADGQPLFSSAHKNLIPSNGGPPSVAQIQSMMSLMKAQRGPAGAAFLNLAPDMLIVPTALDSATSQFINSTQLIPLIGSGTTGAATAGSANPYANRFQIVTNDRLDNPETGYGSGNTTAYYGLADQNKRSIDTIEVLFLTDEPEPVILQTTDFDTDDIKYKMRHSFNAKPLDYRGFVKNPGV